MLFSDNVYDINFIINLIFFSIQEHTQTVSFLRWMRNAMVLQQSSIR